MRWFSRKKPGSERGAEGGSAPKGFLFILQLGDSESDATVSREVMDQLVRATKEPALQALDRYWGTELWCSEIHTNASLQGPCVFFSLQINIRPGETLAGMQDRVGGEFRHWWDIAVENLL